jgi:hypothetical protein
MDIFSIDVTYNELLFMRQTLELPTISGKDAKFLAGLQIKIENELLQIEQMKREEEEQKIKSLNEIIDADKKNNNSKK